MTEPIFFGFEADFVASLRCIPMGVRYNLDTCGIKLKLAQWHRFSEGDRQQLARLACASPEEIAGYRQYLMDLIWQTDQTAASELPIDDNPPWLDGDTIPQDVLAQANAVGRTITVAQWQSLTPLQRFALLKLSRPGHENRNFVPALQDFLG